MRYLILPFILALSIVQVCRAKPAADLPAARRRNRIKPHRLPTRSSLSHILHCYREGHGKLHRFGCCLRCNGRRHLVQGSAALPVPTAAAAAAFCFHLAFGGQLWFCELRKQGVQCSQHNTRFTIVLLEDALTQHCICIRLVRSSSPAALAIFLFPQPSTPYL